jgi:hypothetical protein
MRFGNPGRGKPIDFFTAIVEFSVHGMEEDRILTQRLESPRTPVIHTLIDRPSLQIELIAFATNRPQEGRVDNVIMELRGKGKGEVRAVPLMTVKGDTTISFLCDRPVRKRDIGHGAVFSTTAVRIEPGKPARIFFRFPQEKQAEDRLKQGLEHPDDLLAEARAFWHDWAPYGRNVRWKLAGRYQEFVEACARNIQQAREIKDDRKVFQVGPTVYRGLWIVDGNFILEAGRYLGYDEEVRQGLEATWSYQRPDGGVFAAVTGPHYKDTGIAMFTLVRQCELSQDWSYFRLMAPNLLRAARYLETVRDEERRQRKTVSDYGLITPGFGDGGLGGVRPEFTNTIWALAGLRAAAEAAERLGMNEFAPVRRFHDELHAACLAAAKQEMRRHPRGFEYLPMLFKEDPAWNAPDEWDRPKPQNAQWAMSQALYPGLVFGKDHPITRGHIALMQASTAEDVPIETGWLPHEGLWTYNAPFAAQVYLWAGAANWASRTFTGFLNHATPLYCWREEMPTRGSAFSGYVGDMPHNWASAECLLYMRHMLVLEDGPALRLMAGMTAQEFAQKGGWLLEQTPTRFGRIDFKLTRAAAGWSLEFHRGEGPAPTQVLLPALKGLKVQGAASRPAGGAIAVDPAAASWSATW